MFVSAFSLLLLTSYIQASSIEPRSSGNCPIIHKKPDAECAGTKSTCWSPGQFDLDCDNGRQVCCFDGCVSTCVKHKVCKTVYQTRFENATKVMCNLVEQKPVCTTVTHQDCKNVTQLVDVTIPTKVLEEVCKTIVEPVCENVQMEVCVNENAPTCPVIPLKPAEECRQQKPSSCWSPGVHDLDCKNSALCCFDGCYNHCLYNAPATCRNETTNICKEIVVDQCSKVPEKVCKEVAKPVKIPVTKKVCEKAGKSCMAMTQIVCSDVIANRDCKNVTTEACTEEGKEKCVTTVTERDGELKFEKCEFVEKEVCKKVPEQKCEKVTKEVCPECVKKVVTNKRCKDMPRQDCKKVSKTVNKSVSKEVTTELCHPRTEEKCEKVPAKKVCNNIVKLMSYPVPVLVCE